MPLDPTLATHLANEARRQELRSKIAQMTGELNAASQLTQFIAGHGSDTRRMLTDAQAQLSALEQGAGPGVTDDYGPFSSLDRELRAERAAGKAALGAFVKANPNCGHAEALHAFAIGMDSVRPSTKFNLQDVDGLHEYYIQRLHQQRKIAEPTWEAFRDWVIGNT